MSDQNNPHVSNYVHRGLDLFTEYGQAEALVTDEGRRYTYAEVHDNVLSMAAALWHHGIRSGMAIGVLARNPAESIFFQLGAHLLGCRTAWIANNAPPKFRLSFLELAEVDAFVYDADILPELGEELARAAAPLPVFCFGPGGIGPDLATAPKLSDISQLPFDPLDIQGEPQSLFQTGGTTGSPKLVHHRHGFFAAVAALSDHYVRSGEPKLRHLLASGTWHVSSQTAAFMTLFSGGVLYLMDGLEHPRFLATIEQERINSVLLPPPLLYLLMDDPALAEADFSSMRTFTIAGSAASPARLTQAIERFGPVLRIVYGMSESPFISALPNLDHDPAHPERLASCGIPYGDIQVQIRDGKGVVLPPGEIGEVWLTGSLLMAGYWGMPELTAETLVDGWLRTGDAGSVDADGYLYLVDRLKDMIVTGLSSTNVFCRPVEDVLGGHPQIRAAAVIGVPHETMGEAVHAYVVPVAGATVTGQELRELVAAELNAMWSPVSVDFIEAMPFTDSGKIDKKALRERHLAGVAGGNADGRG